AGSVAVGFSGPLAATCRTPCSRAACERASVIMRTASTTAAPPPPNSNARRCRPGRPGLPPGAWEAPDSEEVADVDVLPDATGGRATTSVAGEGWADRGPMSG